MKISKKLSGPILANYIAAILYALLITIPLYFVVISSFKDNAGIFGNPLGFPRLWDIQNYFEVQERVEMLRAVMISFLITITSLALLLVISFMAAYGIARIAPRFESKSVGFLTETFFGLGFLIPAFALLVPIFLLAATSGLLYNPMYIISYYVAANLPLSIITLASHMRTIPRDLEESAEIDGANRFQVARHVIFPLTRSGLITILVLNFIAIWNEYIFALILLDSKYRTVQIAMPLLRTFRKVDYGLISAGVVLALIPVYLIFIFFQERIISGMRAGSIKS